MKKSMSLIVAALFFTLQFMLPLPAWAQKGDSAQAQTVQDKDVLIKKLKAENLQLRKRVSTLIEDNNFLNENLMNCMQELNAVQEETEKKETPPNR